MPDFVCNNCYFAKDMFINKHVEDMPKKDNGNSNKNFETIKDGFQEYFYKSWCWCSHPELSGPEFHRMKMRHITRNECIPTLSLYQEIPK